MAGLYKLQSEDGEILKVDRTPMKKSPYIYQRFYDAGLNDRNCETADPIHVPVHSSILAMIVRWLYKHCDELPLCERMKFKDFDNWDKDFFKMETGILFALIKAAHTLGIEDLQSMSCAAAAELIKGKSTEEIRQIYGIRTDEEQMEDALAAGGEGTSSATFTVE